jgi:large subunit ribosomal protein L4
MPELGVKDIKNQSAGSISLSEDLFGIKGKEALMHSAVVNYLANQRQGTASTKTRSVVRGGGRKPYKQKGTGRSRAGTIRSPLWRGGGTVFGPRPRDYGYKMPRKARRHALYAALSTKIADGEVIVVDGLAMDEPKTKKMVEVLDNLELGGESLLIVLEAADDNVALSARNIPAVRVKVASDLHAYDVLSHGRLLITRAALQGMEGGAEK